MPRYIDVESLGIGKAKREAFVVPEYADGWNSAIDIIEKAPTAVVADVVRCKDCKYLMRDVVIEETPYGFENELCTYGCRRIFELSGEWVDVMVDDFCSYGARMEGEGE